ncbi:MAG: carboxypeptidase regulatory-like domain-containing protein [Acidobacteriota bacterium]
MRVFRLQGMALALSFLGIAGFVAVSPAPVAYAQTVTTGAISGSVADATGAVVPGATVTIVNVATNAKITLTTDAQGRYNATLLPPGTYKVSATAPGLQSTTSQITALTGTTVPGDLKVSPTANKEVVEVTSSTLPLVDTENVALATTFNEQQIQNLPAPGGDVTTVAFTAPGVVVNTGGGYGNFSSNGLPGISNLFVLNGFDNEDPFLNLNNSGSSNLTLGQGELAEATVIQNAYNSQYGRAAGAIISYTTKSGSNAFHGELDYNWNGSLLNANGWFNQLAETSSGLPKTRPHAVSNEWAANLGGPIIKDKLFFFGDYEGLHYVLPGSSGFLTFPSPQLDAYMLANVAPASQSLYSKYVADFHKSSAYASAKPVENGPGLNQDGNGALGCGDMAGTAAPGGGTFGTNVPCMLVGTGTANNINQEWLFTGRLDYIISDKQKIYGRYKMDHGSQPTSTSFIDPLFSAVSIQPEYEGQFNDSYAISPTKTNVFVAAANWYSAYFGPQNLAASQAELPINFYYNDAGFDGSGVNAAPGLPSVGVPFYLTQGRNVTQYQFEDDFNWIHGKHTFKTGVNFRRDLVSDYDQRVGVQFPFALLFDLQPLANGNLTDTALPFGYNQYNQAFDPLQTAHLALYNFGIYFEDDYQVLDNLKLTLGVRIDRTGNPLCHQGCFSEYSGGFPGTGAAFNSTIKPQNWNAFPSVEPFQFQPRVGFNYGVNQRTEIRGGVGLFADLYPASLLDSAIQNFPNYNNETIYVGNVGTSGPGTTGAYAVAANDAVQSGFAAGQGPAQIAQTLNANGSAASVPFSPPSIGAYFPGKWRIPEYLEYSLQFQRQMGPSDALILTYAGNYGYNGIIQNPWVNAGVGIFNDGPWTGSGNTFGGWSPAGTFGTFSTTPADPRFGKITEYTNNAHSNYNGAMLTWKHSGHGLTSEVSYTYSHSLDEVSNGGVGLPFGPSPVLNQLTPDMSSDNLNYSNSDYDIRHDLVGDGSYETPYTAANPVLKNVLGGWVLGAKAYYRSGMPFSITNGGPLGNFPNLSGNTLTAQVASPFMVSNLINNSRNSAHDCAYGTSRCMEKTQYVPAGSQSDFGNLRRNVFSGPHYADIDMQVLKKIVNRERFSFQLGADAYNVLNKVNFATPASDINSSNFGLIESAVAPPTSPYGSFQGAAVTQRLFVLHGRVTF